MSQRHHHRRNPHRAPVRRKKQSSCGVPVAVLVLLVLVGSVFAPPGFFQNIWAIVNQQVGQQSGVEERIEALADQALPTFVAELPPASVSENEPLPNAPEMPAPVELRVSEQEINTQLAAQQESLDPLESVTIHFVPGQIQLDLIAYGIRGRITSGLAVQDGRVIVTDPQLDGPLGPYISIDDLAASLERQMNDELLAQGQTLRDVRIEQGSIVLLVE